MNANTTVKGNPLHTRYSWWLLCLISVSLLTGIFITQPFLPSNLGNNAIAVKQQASSSSSLILKIKSDIPRNNKDTVVSIYMDTNANYGASFVNNGMLQKYGELNYTLHDFDSDANTSWLQRVTAPCILVGRRAALKMIQNLQAAPHCYTWLSNDERCRNIPPSDIRFYHYDPLKEQRSGTKGGLYLPLGPRKDAMQAFREIAAESVTSSINDNSNSTAPAPSLQIPPPVHERPYVLNAIFSQSTSPGRQALFGLLNGQEAKRLANLLNWKFFLTMPKKWELELTENHVATKDYVKVLQKSIFTLSPHGHNPECFRMFEAIQAGSIPVVVIDEEYKTHDCPNAFRPFLEPIMLDDNTTISPPPIVILNQQTDNMNGWDGLFDTLEALMQDIPGLQKRQEALLTWQHAFYRHHVSQLEKMIRKQPFHEPRKYEPRKYEPTGTKRGVKKGAKAGNAEGGEKKRGKKEGGEKEGK